MNPVCRKIYLELKTPDDHDFVAEKDRIIRGLQPRYQNVHMSMDVLKSCYKELQDSDWKITVTMVDTGPAWNIIRVEKGNTTGQNYAYAADLGSTTVAMQIIELNSGQIVGEESILNYQVTLGEEILSRIYYAKDNDDHLEEIRHKTLRSLRELMEKLQASTGVAPAQCGVLVIGGNTTMVHFLLGFDPWLIFYTPFTPAFNSCGFVTGKSMGLPFDGLVYCFPSISNYVGGDVVSGLLASEMYKKDELALFVDIGTNGEMLLGNNQFLIAAAGAAGPALEGGISDQGMRAEPGAVDTVRIVNNKLLLTTIDNKKPIGICGSGIVDLLAEMLLAGWIDYAGAFVPGQTERIVARDGEYAVVYAWASESGSGKELIFTRHDISRFMDTKAAVNTMVAFLLETMGIQPHEIQRVYTAGAFGTFINLESAITIGLYPDLPRDSFVFLGNGSITGARMLLQDRALLAMAENIFETVLYLQLAEARDFLNKMYAAKFLPHTNFELYPTVIARLKELKVSRNKG